MFEHFVFGGLAIMVTCVTLDPLALRPRLSPGLPLSNDIVVTDVGLTNKTSLGTAQARRAQRRCGFLFRRPGDPGHLRDFRPVGFASPAFAGFAFVGQTIQLWCAIIVADIAAHGKGETSRIG